METRHRVEWNQDTELRNGTRHGPTKQTQLTDAEYRLVSALVEQLENILTSLSFARETTHDGYYHGNRQHTTHMHHVNTFELVLRDHQGGKDI